MHQACEIKTRFCNRERCNHSSTSKLGERGQNTWNISDIKMSCHFARHRYHIKCCAMTQHDIIHHVMSWHAMPCHAMPRHSMSCHVMPCHVVSWLITSCHVVFRHVASHHATSRYITPHHTTSRPAAPAASGGIAQREAYGICRN